MFGRKKNPELDAEFEIRLVCRPVAQLFERVDQSGSGSEIHQLVDVMFMLYTTSCPHPCRESRTDPRPCPFLPVWVDVRP
jgi:hypothetical protein